jgi:hypothetical protein
MHVPRAKTTKLGGQVNPNEDKVGTLDKLATAKPQTRTAKKSGATENQQYMPLKKERLGTTNVAKAVAGNPNVPSKSSSKN